MTIPEDYFVYRCDLDAEEPYCIACSSKNVTRDSEIKILIPYELAYYLRTHFCGSEKMHKIIEDNTRSSIAYNLLKILGIKGEIL
jgi:hypothetical protein